MPFPKGTDCSGRCSSTRLGEETVAQRYAADTGAINYRRLPRSVADLVKIGRVASLPVAEEQAVIQVK